MRDILFLVLNVLLLVIGYIVKDDHNDFLMVIALYCLVGYWILGKDSSIKMQLGGVRLWAIIKLVLIILAYLIFNYFVFKQSFSADFELMIFAGLWFLITSGLLYFNYRKIVDNTKPPFS